MEKNNLLVLVENIGVGGQERVAVNTANILNEDYNIVLAIFYKEEYNYKFDGVLLNLEIPPVQGTVNKINTFINLYQRVCAVKKLKREYKIDVTISFGNVANIVNVLTKTSDKVLVSIRGYNHFSRSIMGKIKGEVIYGIADTVVTVAKNYRRI